MTLLFNSNAHAWLIKECCFMTLGDNSTKNVAGMHGVSFNCQALHNSSLSQTLQTIVWTGEDWFEKKQMQGCDPW